MEENLKKELHSVKLQLNSTMENNKIIEETVITLKQEFKQKETKLLTDFSNLTHLNDKLENKLHSQDQSIQTVHMMLNPAQVYDQKTKTALGAQNPFYLRQAKKAQPALYDGEELLKTNHVPVVVPSSEEDLELAETLKHFDGVQKSLVTEVRAMKAVFENLEAEVDQNEIDLKSGEIERKNLVITNENLVAEYLSKDVFYTATDSVLNVSRFSDMHEAFTVAHKQRFGNKKPVTSLDAPSFDSKFVIAQLNEQIQSRGNTIRELKEKISRLTKKISDADPIFDPKALVSQNKDLTAKLNALHDLNERFRAENAKTQLKEKMPCVTIDAKPLKVFAFKKCAIDVEPISPRQRNNRNVHHGYLNSLKDTLDTLREIVKEARSELPSDSNLDYACVYTKRSQELLANASASCPKTNVSILPSTGVNTATIASRSKPRSNTNKDRTMPAKSAMKQVEAYSKMNKSNVKQKNHVDSSIGYKRTVINSNSNTSCKTCNKCLISVNHDQSVVNSAMFVMQSPATKVWQVKQVKKVKQAWQATGKLNTLPKILPTKQWKPTGRLLPLERQCPLVRSTALVIQIVLWYLDSGCSKHMTRDRSRLKNFVKRDLDGVDLIKGNHGTNLYTISVEDMMRSSPVCLLSKASKNKSWLWHRRLNHLNFGTLNDLAYKDLVRGLPRLKFEKDHLCSACQLGKSKKATHKPKITNTIMEVLHTLHMDLCGPMRVQSINGKKYILVIVNDYFRFTWVKFLRSKDKTPAFVINLFKQLQVGLNKTVKFVRTDNGTEFVNKVLTDYYESVGITHEKTVPRTPQQNGVVERRNRTIVEVVRTMLIFSKAPLFLWAEAVATVCYTENRSLIHTLYNKTPYELVHEKKPDLSFLCIFRALCYPTNDNEDLGKLKAKADIWFFVAEQSIEVNPFALADPEPFINVFALEPSSATSSSREISIAEPNHSTQPHEHLQKWTDSHPIDNIIGNPS
ncbi:retrovirus-related pol polyprotein from transposon TNT 1-94 [Tanacetum coccineum]